MIQARARQLADLLKEMREQDRGYFPDEAWLEIQRTFAIPYVEVVLARRQANGIQFFLAQRDDDDPYWPGRPWHIPGGIWRTGNTRERACTDVAQREVGVAVTFCREVMTFKWPDHPYANPISHVCLCAPTGPVEETASARFFAFSDLPQPLLMHHQSFLNACHARVLNE